jgi:hypothetical protein
VSLALIVDIIGDASKLSGELDKSGKEVGGWADGLGGSGVKVAALAGVAGIAAVAIADMTSAAAADRDEQNKLEAAIVAAGAATGDYNALVDDAIAKGQDRAFTDSETRDALQSLVTATGDVSQATDLLTQTQDIARLAGVDLATAADAVAKAQSGQDGALRKLIPGLAKGATATDTIALASKKAAGQADLYAESSAGMGARTSDAFGEISETIGSVFLPVLDAVLPALIPILKSLAQLVQAILPLLIPLIKILAGALGAVASVLVVIVGWLVKLVTWLTKAAGKVGDLLAQLNPLKGFKMPSLPFLSASSAGASAAGAGTRAAPAQLAAAPSGVTVNVYGAVDPEATARQIRRILTGHAIRTGASVGI